jgi:hypothetical protein
LRSVDDVVGDDVAGTGVPDSDPLLHPDAIAASSVITVNNLARIALPSI